MKASLPLVMAYAERSGITIIGNYIDRAMSARTADRPDFQRMINDNATYKHILKKNGVKVISATENISDSPEGILLEGLSEYYSAELSVKIQRGQMENAMKGKNNGGTVPLGLRKGPGRCHGACPHHCAHRAGDLPAV
ncbi:MAG: recombinase family protein [Clostridia bacterium]|nr:recombinase family protein [Clostridia bacterium]